MPAPIAANSAFADTGADVTASITGLFIYPVKSCAGIALDAAAMTPTGLAFDRHWMVVDAAGEFATQRELPRMALVRPALSDGHLLLRAPGMADLSLAITGAATPTQVRLWGSALAALDVGDPAARWFTEFLQPGSASAFRLVRFDPAARHLSSLRWTGGIEAPNEFNDGFPVLVISAAALDGLNQRLARSGHAAVGMERFRPNIVLGGLDAHDEDHLGALTIDADGGAVQLALCKPCPRCPIPNVDPATGESHPAVGDALASYRRDDRVGGAVTFGMNAVITAGAGSLLRVGQAVRANYRFD